MTINRVGGLHFVAISPGDATARVIRAATRPDRTRGEHVHLANAYSVALAASDPDLAGVYAEPHGWVLPDGKPVTWISRLRRDRAPLRQVRGPQLMLDVADEGRRAGVRHYLLGGSAQVLEDLAERLHERFPGIALVGSSAPPFRAPTMEELERRNTDIAASGAQIVWVGLGTPKQDFEAARLASALPVVAVAVGAAFDYAAGARRTAPHWISAIGMEWAWRFGAEPRRLWRRYTVWNARFLLVVRRGEAQRRRDARTARWASRQDAVVVVGQLPPPLHGSAVMTQRLIEAVGALGHPVRVVDRRFSRSVAEVGAVGLRKLLAVPSLVLRFVIATRGGGPVVMLITTRPTTFLLDALLLAMARRPAVLYVHTVGFRDLAARSRAWGALVRHVLGRAARVVVLGDSLTDDVRPFTASDRLVVIPNCTPTMPPLEHRTAARLLFLSNLMAGKGADAFVRLAERLRLARPDIEWRFDIAGAGDPGQLLPLPEGVELHGRVEGRRKDRLLKSADLLVLPSTYAMEAQPLVIVEAMSYGLPVVAYDNGGIRDLVDDSTGALVPREDEDGLLRAVLSLLQDEVGLQARRVAAQRRHAQRHSLPAFALAWEAVLKPGAGVRVPVEIPASLAETAVGATIAVTVSSGRRRARGRNRVGAP